MKANSGEPVMTQAKRAEVLRASPQLFANPLMDRLSRVPWWTPLVLYTPIIIILAVMSLSYFPVLYVGLAVVSGYLIWTLVEYLGHRFLFHAPFPGKWGASLHFLIHGVHHDHPHDPLRLVMPPIMSLPIMAIAFLVAWALFGMPNGLPYLAGFVIGYTAYDMVHYYVHHANPKTRIGRKLRQLHMLHHFKDDDRGFGVSAPWWDYIFGTAIRPKR